MLFSPDGVHREGLSTLVTQGDITDMVTDKKKPKVIDAELQLKTAWSYLSSLNVSEATRIELYGNFGVNVAMTVPGKI